MVTEPTPVQVDLSPVAMPDGLVGFARVKKPQAVLDMAGKWTGFPMPNVDVLVEFMIGESVGRVLDASQPIDAALVVNTKTRSIKPMIAVSAAVRSMDEAKSAFSKGKLEPWTNGALRITGLGPPGEEDEHLCVLAPSVGAASARLVCGDSEPALEALVPYLTRTAPKESTTSDLHVMLRTEPVRETIQQMRSGIPALIGLMGGRGGLGGPPVFREMVEAVVGDAVDLASDLDKVEIDGDLADAGASLNATAHFRSSNSLLARIATSHPERTDVPPAAFWHLPAETDIAYFHRGVDEKELAHPKQLLDAVLMAVFEEGNLPDAQRRALADVSMKSISLLANPLVFAKGVDSAGIQKAQAAQKAVKPGDRVAEEDARRAMKEQTGGWYLLGYGDPAAKLAQPLKDWVTVWNNPAFVKWMKDRRGKDAQIPTMKLTAAPKGLPKDTTHFEFSIPGYRFDPPQPPGSKTPAAKLPPPKPTVLHVVVVPDGGKSWVGFALDANMISTKIIATLPNAPEAGTIAKRPGLEMLHEGKMGAAGFVTLRGVVTGLPIRDALRSEGFADPFKSINDRQGIVPLPFTLTAENGSGGGIGNFVVKGKLSKEAIGDVVRYVMRDGKF